MNHRFEASPDAPYKSTVTLAMILDRSTFEADTGIRPVTAMRRMNDAEAEKALDWMARHNYCDLFELTSWPE